MEIFIILLVVVVVAIAFLVRWVNRRNSGGLAAGETGAENYSAETRKDWGPR
jgi:hypothetical protein